jgi:hypothetical protein
MGKWLTPKETASENVDGTMVSGIKATGEMTTWMDLAFIFPQFITSMKASSKRICDTDTGSKPIMFVYFIF